MPWYNDLRPEKDHDRKEYSLVFPGLSDNDRRAILPNLLHLRAALAERIPVKKNDHNLLLASWNIKEFGHLDKRLPESYMYIAEIISKFDLIAIQEIKSTLKDLLIVMKLLDNNFGYVITDVTEGNDGNSERFGYIYDKRKVIPSGLSGEITLWDEITQDSPIRQLKRSPAITGFKAGWKSFIIINIHLHPGNNADDKSLRKEEVRLLIKAIEEKIKRGHLWNENIILLGDTNLYRNNEDIIQLFHDSKFKESEGLEGKVTNVSNNEIYDRIFLRTNDFFQLIHKNGKENGDVFNVYDHVFTEASRRDYHDVMIHQKDDASNLTSDTAFRTYYHRYWKRNQVSDHNPVWIEILIDSSDLFLSQNLSAMG
ncbi:endonuclease/exonuclease/phosphatase family protein [Desulfobacula sp.]|uniref:endonuclease/exonuclease/phosphatase family protein n=1 Tax=Desulfobacula sp. TaxID=2593537 RepID=UPI0026136DC9|nr:endonuclease/exonuclease/phosphatase family protein [Desulfobacula sp.]